MAHARRKTGRARKPKSDHRWLFFFSGIVVGVLSTVFYLQPENTDSVEIGSGIKSLLNSVADPKSNQDSNPAPVAVAKKPENSKLTLDFYEKLSLPTPAYDLVESSIDPRRRQDPDKDIPTEGTTEKGELYVLQAGAFQSYSDADRLKAQLALQGLEAHIMSFKKQDISTFRVRLGPYINFTRMSQTTDKLKSLGITPIQLKVKS